MCSYQAFSESFFGSGSCPERRPRRPTPSARPRRSNGRRSSAARQLALRRRPARLADRPALRPSSGSVRIDGVDIRDIRLADLAAIVGVVSQETYLLHTTVRENLRYAKPGATDAEIEDAARAAQIHDLIAGLPDGYDTMVGCGR